MVLWRLLKRRWRHYMPGVLIVIAAISVLYAPSSAAPRRASASGTTRVSADVCSQHPELFGLRRLPLMKPCDLSGRLANTSRS
jgi:hypothetical protein